MELRLEWAARQAAAEMQKQVERSNAEAARLSLQREQMRQQAEVEAQQRQQLLDLKARQERERVARRDAAWRQFFKPSPACQSDSATAHCANEYMAARKRLDAQYVDLKP